jgi:hypothetical protein
VTLEERLEKIEAMLLVLVERHQMREWYSVEEFARVVRRAEFTCREWCRHGRINAEKKDSGRGAYASWAISPRGASEISAGTHLRPVGETAVGWSAGFGNEPRQSDTDSKKSKEKEMQTWFRTFASQGIPVALQQALRRYATDEHAGTLRAKKAAACLFWITQTPMAEIEKAVTQHGGALDRRHLISCRPLSPTASLSCHHPQRRGSYRPG